MNHQWQQPTQTNANRSYNFQIPVLLTPFELQQACQPQMGSSLVNQGNIDIFINAYFQNQPFNQTQNIPFNRTMHQEKEQSQLNIIQDQDENEEVQQEAISEQEQEKKITIKKIPFKLENQFKIEQEEEEKHVSFSGVQTKALQDKLKSSAFKSSLLTKKFPKQQNKNEQKINLKDIQNQTDKNQQISPISIESSSTISATFGEQQQILQILTQKKQSNQQGNEQHHETFQKPFMSPTKIKSKNYSSQLMQAQSFQDQQQQIYQKNLSNYSKEKDCSKQQKKNQLSHEKIDKTPLLSSQKLKQQTEDSEIHSQGSSSVLNKKGSKLFNQFQNNQNPNK